MQISCAGCEPAHTCTLLSHTTHQPELDGLHWSCSSGGKCQTHKFHHRREFVCSLFLRVFLQVGLDSCTPRSEQRSQPPITRTASDLCDSSRAFLPALKRQRADYSDPYGSPFECEETLVAIQVHSCASEGNLTDLTVLAETKFA